MFDIFLRILRNSFKFRFNQKVAQSQRLLPPGEELNPSGRLTGGKLTTILPRNEVLPFCLLTIQIIGSETSAIIR